MKLGLLLVLAVVAVVPSLSEGRMVSRCELRDELKKVITLPKRLRPHTDLLLAIVTCEVERRSHLETNLTKVFGHRKPLTTAAPTTTTTAGDNETIVQATTRTTTTAPTTTTSQPPTTASPISTNSSSESNSTVDGGRKKRAAPRKTSKRSDSDPEESLADVLNEEENKFDEQEMMADDNHMDEEEDDIEEDALEESTGSRRDRRSLRHKLRKAKSKKKKTVPWSLGFYGVFLLSDSHFCQSGYRWSRNVCHSSCSAFSDDDIKDDVACFVRSGYWRFLLRSPSRQCRHVMKTYFDECK